MTEILKLNDISKVAENALGNNYTLVKESADPKGIMLRSFNMHEYDIPSSVLCVGRAGAGVNNIPIQKCSEQGIVVFNTPGANANAVKELVLCGLLLASRKVTAGIEWTNTLKGTPDISKQVEKGKKSFVGPEIYGKTLGIIGLGAIGVLVANTAVHLGMEVYGYDPYLSVDAAWKLSRHIYHAKTTEEIYRECDYITIHVPALESTKGMINKAAIDMMKDDVIILNYARDVLVNEKDLMDALEAGKVKRYVTDFANPTVAGKKGVIVTPHLAASTEESEDNCAKMAVKELMDFLENGNIKNSVNYPNCDMGHRGDHIRVTILHRNVPNMIGQFTSVFGEAGINIENMTNKSRNEYAYTMLDAESTVTEELVKKLEEIKDVLKVRVIA